MGGHVSEYNDSHMDELDKIGHLKQLPMFFDGNIQLVQPYYIFHWQTEEITEC